MSEKTEAILGVVSNSKKEIKIVLQIGDTEADITSEVLRTVMSYMKASGLSKYTAKGKELCFGDEGTYVDKNDAKYLVVKKTDVLNAVEVVYDTLKEIRRGDCNEKTN